MLPPPRFQLSDLSKEQLNLLKLLVDPDALRSFLKKLKKGAFEPISRESLKEELEGEDLLDENSLPALLVAAKKGKEIEECLKEPAKDDQLRRL